MREASRFRARIDDKAVVHMIDDERWAMVRHSLRGQEVDVVIGRHVKPRSLSQNAYYWAVVLGYAADWSGSSEEECHQAYRDLYCPPKPVSIPGREVLIRSTRLLSTEEFGDYLNRVVADLHQSGVEVPPARGVER